MKALIVVMTVAALALLGGCARQPVAEQEPVLQVQSDNRILRNRLQVDDLVSRPVGDLQQVQVRLNNLWAFELAIQYQFKWFDAEGFEIEPQSRGWLPLVIGGKSAARVQGVSPHADAVRYELWVRD